ncbi:HugZ family protein (plasmid) [Pseudoalteromonas sp. T1lg65]|uniref:HugZ family pyridoxamine 5'-phosphate oxidase n=1 Tax=Pseudoalteromonas sp. T1lg65 TaxID=2077101 RepID=UPI003F7AB488
MREQAAFEARTLVRQSNVCVISTISKNLAGYPFGSVSPFMSDNQGRLVFYIAGIAQHSRNLSEDSKMCATVFNAAEQGDQNAHARVTVVGDASPVPAEEHEALLARYERQYPEAVSYRQAHDFQLWRMEVKRVRYIGGFGHIFWIEKDEWQQAEPEWDLDAEAHMVKHMNDDHSDANRLILKLIHNISAEQVEMTTIVSDGCYLRANEKNYYIQFENVCLDSMSVRKELVRLTKAAREQLAEYTE